MPAYTANICHRRRVASETAAMTAKAIIAALIKPLPELPASLPNQNASEHHTLVERTAIATSAKLIHLRIRFTWTIPKRRKVV
jgi:hypothetical protein